MSKAVTEDENTPALTVTIHEECVNCDYHRCLEAEEAETILGVCPRCEHNISPVISVMPTPLRQLSPERLVEGVTEQANYLQTLQESGWEPDGFADGPTVYFEKSDERTRSNGETMEVPLPEQ